MWQIAKFKETELAQLRVMERERCRQETDKARREVYMLRGVHVERCARWGEVCMFEGVHVERCAYWEVCMFENYTTAASVNENDKQQPASNSDGIGKVR